MGWSVFIGRFGQQIRNSRHRHISDPALGNERDVVADGTVHQEMVCGM